jgi:hypothetical protein
VKNWKDAPKESSVYSQFQEDKGWIKLLNENCENASIGLRNSTTNPQSVMACFLFQFPKK